MTVPVAWGSRSAAEMDLGALRISALRFPPGLALPAHSHDRPTLAVVVTGAFESELGRDVEVCRDSSLRTEPAGSSHTNQFGPHGAQVAVVQPDPYSAVMDHVGDALERASLRRDTHVGLLGRAIVREFRRRDAVSRIALEGLGLELVAEAARTDDAQRGVPTWLAQATDLLNEHFRDALRIETIAETVGVRPTHLARAFRAVHQQPIGSYVRRLRLEWVARRLARSDDAIAGLAHEAGFADQAHLTRAFRAQFGVTPARYRRTLRT